MLVLVNNPLKKEYHTLDILHSSLPHLKSCRELASIWTSKTRNCPIIYSVDVFVGEEVMGKCYSGSLGQDNHSGTLGLCFSCVRLFQISGKQKRLSIKLPKSMSGYIRDSPQGFSTSIKNSKLTFLLSLEIFPSSFSPLFLWLNYVKFHQSCIYYVKLHTRCSNTMRSMSYFIFSL